MAISPWQKGATGPAWAVTFPRPPAAYGDTPGPFDLTDNGGITLTFIDNRRGEDDPNYSRVGGGSWHVTDAVNGLATYTPILTDVDTEGDFSIIVSVVGADDLTYKWPPARFVVTSGRS